MLDKQRIRAFVVGGLAGAVAGILFAPKSGKELRGSITSRAGEARERGRETYFEAQERVQESVAEARERSPRRGGLDAEGAVADSLAELRPSAPEPGLDPGPPVEVPPAVTPSDPPSLRDVSQDVATPPGDEPEEIRRRIRETRSRLERARLDMPEPEDVPEEGRDV